MTSHNELIAQLERLWAVVQAHRSADASSIEVANEARGVNFLEVVTAMKAARPEVEWKPINTAPLGKMVWLWHRAWRHPFPGQCVNHETGMSVIDTCTPKATTWDTHATHWREMDIPQLPQHEGKS